MKHTEALDALATLYEMCDHPDIERVYRYGSDSAPGGNSPAGLCVTYRSSGSASLLWTAVEPRPAPTVAMLPDEMPPPSERALRALAFTVRLLDFAHPPVFSSWEPCDYPGVWLSPSALRVLCADGTTIYLRVTVTSGPRPESDIDPYSEYHFPEGLRRWPLVAPAQSVAR